MKKYAGGSSADSSVVVCVSDTQQLIENVDDDSRHDDLEEGGLNANSSSPVSIPSRQTKSLTLSCSCPAQTHFASW